MMKALQRGLSFSYILIWPGVVREPIAWPKRPGTWIEQVVTDCRDGKKYVGYIELSHCDFDVSLSLHYNSN